MVEIRDLSKSFGGWMVLDRLSLTVPDGETLCVLGATGCGKTTLLRCIAGLEKPDSGSVLVDGKVCRKLSGGGKQRVGMVFQSYNLFPHLDILHNVMLAPMRVLGMKRADAEKLAITKLQQVGLAEKALCRVEELSAGQRQRVAIARALAMEPLLLLFDEPTSALDPTMVSELQCLVRDLSKKGMTMIIVTHDLQFAREVCSRVAFIAEGEVYEQGTAEEIFEYPKRELTNVFVNTILDYNYTIHSCNYDLYELQAGMIQFCKRHALERTVQFRVQLLAEEVLNVVPLDRGDVGLSLRYSKKNGTMSLEILMPQGVPSILNGSDFELDELSMSIISGLCDEMDEVVDDNARVRLRFQLKENI